MSEEIEQSVKILFSFYSNVLDEWTKETIWADVLDREKGLYKLDSIPFYASVASGDIVSAEYDQDEQFLLYKSTIEYSGNSTLQIVLMNETADISKVRDEFANMGCESEQLNNRYFAMEIPAEVKYGEVRKKLQELREIGILDFAESALSSNHHHE